jgi:NAD(P)-dependent dehydrogenase (short-subunit alcohol dehydrogenase family)
MAGLEGKICVITGATSGIGLATAERLVGMGAQLILVGRDAAKERHTRERLSALKPGAAIEILTGDLGRLGGVRDLAREIAARAPRIDVLVNNAGAIFDHRAENGDGLERTFALNHMAYYLMTRLLDAPLKAAAPSRVVIVSSTAHRGAELDFDDLQCRERYSGWTAYRRSKLANILFTRRLSRHWAGSGVTANSLHPGFVASRFGDNNSGMFRTSLAVGKRMLAISTERGADTSVHLASAPEVAGMSGLYFDQCKPVEPSAAAQNDATAERLWLESARIAGLPVWN